MNFDLDVFVSYAHLDDTVVAEDAKGWVAKLHEKLEQRLAQLLGKSPRIWRDPKLQGDDVFAETLVDHLKRAAVLVSVVTPRYVRSEWARRELVEFCKAAEQQGIQMQHKSRIFKVLKTPVPLDQQAPPLPSLLGYEFFKVDPENGNFREFDADFGPEYLQKFNMKLDDLAQDLKELLEFVEGSELTQAPAGGGDPAAVFLAVTTLDLHDQREAIKRDLQQHGYTVLPVRELPLIGTDVDAAVREDLARCAMSIHLVGTRYSLTPEGAEMSLVEIQHKWAIERGERGGFSRLVWIPPGLQVTDVRQQKVIEQLRMNPRMGPGADLLESPLEVLLTVVQDTLQRARTPKPAVPPAVLSSVSSIYLIYDERDTAVVSPWADFLFEQGLEVIHPVFQGDEADVREYHEENLRTADGVVIFFGAAGELWLRRKFREVQKIAGYGRTKPAPLVAVCVLPPVTPEKDRFRSHECVVVPQWDGLSPDPWLPIVARLKG